MAFVQSPKKIHELSEKHLKFAELLAEGTRTKAQACRDAGFSTFKCRHPDLIGPTRERSRYPALWDYFQELKKRRLRLFDISADAIREELKLIAFSNLTDFIRIPTKRDLKRKEVYDAKIRKSMGYTDAEDEEIISEEEQNPEAFAETDIERLYNFAPGASIRLKCLEDIPEELRPAIAEISETRDGIKVKLHSKIEALDKLARMLRLYEEDKAADKPTTIENLNIIVNGSKSDLLTSLTAQAGGKKKAA